MFAPGGITGLLMMHRPLIKRRHARQGAAQLSDGAGADAGDDRGLDRSRSRPSCITPSSSGDDPHIRPFGVRFDAASPCTWVVAAVLLIGGFLVARLTWPRVGAAWDDAAGRARDKGDRRMSAAIELARRRRRISAHVGHPRRQSRRSPQGERHALIGPNGAGKSTTLQPDQRLHHADHRAASCCAAR